MSNGRPLGSLAERNRRRTEAARDFRVGLNFKRRQADFDRALLNKELTISRIHAKKGLARLGAPHTPGAAGGNPTPPPPPPLPGGGANVQTQTGGLDQGQGLQAPTLSIADQITLHRRAIADIDQARILQQPLDTFRANRLAEQIQRRGAVDDPTARLTAEGEIGSAEAEAAGRVKTAEVTGEAGKAITQTTQEGETARTELTEEGLGARQGAQIESDEKQLTAKLGAASTIAEKQGIIDTEIAHINANAQAKVDRISELMADRAFFAAGSGKSGDVQQAESFDGLGIKAQQELRKQAAGSTGVNGTDSDLAKAAQDAMVTIGKPAFTDFSALTADEQTQFLNEFGKTTGNITSTGGGTAKPGSAAANANDGLTE